MRNAGYAAAFAAALWITAAGLPAQATAPQTTMVPSNGELDFTVLRDGADVGSHRIDFHRNGEQLEVDIKTRIAVKLAFITVFRFEHDGHEVWQDNRLVAMQTKTNDDGEDHTLVATANGKGGLDIVGDGQKRTADGSVIPASLWNSSFLDSKELLNSLVGTDLNIDVAYKGEEQVKVNGAEVPAKHYSMTGDFARELWYDKNKVLVKIAFKAEDGSDIQYVRR